MDDDLPNRLHRRHGCAKCGLYGERHRVRGVWDGNDLQSYSQTRSDTIPLQETIVGLINPVIFTSSPDWRFNLFDYLQACSADAIAERLWRMMRKWHVIICVYWAGAWLSLAKRRVIDPSDVSALYWTNGPVYIRCVTWRHTSTAKSKRDIQGCFAMVLWPTTWRQYWAHNRCVPKGSI